MDFNVKSKRVLIPLFCLSVIILIAVENGKVNAKVKWFDIKYKAARLMLKSEIVLKNYRLDRGVIPDAVNDPSRTALVGQEYTRITTSYGSLPAKLTVMNPNTAAVIVDLMMKADLKENDCIAVGLSGSFPALNIAVMAAIEALNLKPIIITSVGSSSWGANDPYFTWLDMEVLLYDKSIIKTKSIASSTGGGNDNGSGLSPKGRELIKDAIIRNKTEFIKEEFLVNSIDKRMELFDKYSEGSLIKAYINVGGGIASLGSDMNARIFHNGLIKKLPAGNYPVRGVINKMAEQGIPVINLHNVSKIMKNYSLPEKPFPLPKPGTGVAFYTLKYDLRLVIGGLAIYVLIIVIIILMELRTHKQTEFRV